MNDAQKEYLEKMNDELANRGYAIKSVKSNKVKS